jgi:hypothetical protein
MIDLQSISSNLLLVGFALIGICCLYLLYSNFSKIREINELKRNVEDLKNIFFNQQKHNEETYNNILNVMNNDDKNNVKNVDNVVGVNPIEVSDSVKTKNINIDEKQNIPTIPTIIKLTKDNINNITNVNNMLNKSLENNEAHKNINLEDLDDLDKLDSLNEETLSNLELDDCEDCEDDENSNNLMNENKINDNIFDIIHSIKTNGTQDIFNDNDSITTEPIIDNLDETTFDINDLNNLMDSDEECGEECGEECDEECDEECGEECDEECGEECDEECGEECDEECDDDNITKTFSDNLDNLDDLDDLNLDDTDLKLININNTSTLNETIINNTTPDINTKSINVSQSNDLDTETIELDKLLSGDIKNINIENKSNKINKQIDTKTDINIDTSLDNLNTMSIKQLKDVAKHYKVKTSGTKNELIQAISKVINS